MPFLYCSSLAKRLRQNQQLLLYMYIYFHIPTTYMYVDRVSNVLPGNRTLYIHLCVADYLVRNIVMTTWSEYRIGTLASSVKTHIHVVATRRNRLPNIVIYYTFVILSCSRAIIYYRYMSSTRASHSPRAHNRIIWLRHARWFRNKSVLLCVRFT